MSVNRDTCLLYRDHAKASSGERTLLVFEHNNMSNFDKSSHSTYYTDGVKDIMFCAHTYTRIECLIQYFDTRFEHCEVTITDRFTMDSTRFTLEHTNATHGSGSNPKYYNRQVKDYSIAQFAYDQTARTDTDDRINGKKFTNVTLLLSMADFPHYGDIVFQFYGQNESTKDTYSDPVIVQFTNAPTVYQSNLYKWHPHNKTDQNQYDPDNVFNSAFGEFWNSAAETRSAADTGRTNVLTANAADGYIDVYTDNRLMTNGIRDWGDPAMSLSGHPMYIAHYDSFVPKSFSDTFGIEQRPVKFATIPLQEELGSNCCAYLTTSGSTDAVTNPDDAFNIRIKQVSPDESSNNMKLIVVSGADAGANSALTGYHQRFNAYIGCISGNADLSDGNGTLFKNRKSDAWYRTHTMLHANFALTNVDPYWLANTEEFMTDYSYRHYRIIDDYADYGTPIAERKWVYHGWGTRYYTLNKGCYEDRYNPENWTMIYEARYSNRSSTSVIIPTTTFDKGIEVDNDGAPILILEHTGDVNCIDSELVKRMVHRRYDSTIGYYCKFALSCDDVKDDPYMFKVMSLITTSERRAVIYRVSDMAYPTRSFDDGYNGDGEWAIMIARNV